MLLLRLSPLIPYNALDYISGVTSISIKHYSMALLGLLPGAVTLCYVGATASSLAEGTSATTNDKGLQTAIMVFGLFFAIAGGVVASYYSKLELDKILLQECSDSGSNSEQQQGGLLPISATAPATCADNGRGESHGGAASYQDIQPITSEHSLT